MAITNQEIVKAIKAGGVVTSLGELAAGDAITLKGDGGSETGQITLNNAGNTAGTVLKSGAVSSSVTFTLPTADGSNGQVLSTNGSGVLSFSDDSGISLATARGGISINGTNGTASDTGGLAYNSGTGVITFSPSTVANSLIPSTTASGSIVFKEGTDNGTNTITLQGGDNLGGSYVVTLPTTQSTNLIGNDTTDTLTNKTLTAPVITSVTSGGNAITFPNSTAQTLAGLAEDQTFLAANRGTVTDNTTSMDFNLTTSNNFKCAPAAGSITLTFNSGTIPAASVGQSGNIYVDNTNAAVVSTAGVVKTPSNFSITTSGKYWLSYFVADTSNVLLVPSAALL